ncbi:unnamed protein product [Cylindrotheca closterium]|uniref:DUF6824 domain-containing protein n=1 Tax=Cylindrotheca closterium TaxID=2856 RepID=A0AAD2FZQ2_9STRA|nr:unnamed protein product [Cylindrotheca closterium]
MMSEYYNPCSIFEPLMDLLPCSSYDQQQLPMEENIGTPRHSNRSPIPESCIQSVPSTMSESSHYTQEHISTLRKVGRRDPQPNLTPYNHDDHGQFRPMSPYPNGEPYKMPPPQTRAEQSSWFPPFMTPGSWYGTEKSSYDGQWHPSNYCSYYPEMPFPSAHPSYNHNHQSQEHQEEAPPYQEQHKSQQVKEAPKYSQTAPAEVSPSPSKSREELCPTPSSTSSAVTDSIESKRDLRTLDIVCGRGAPTNFHYGNQVFRELVEDHQTTYLCSKRSDKPHIAMKILDLVKAAGGRFVRRQRTAEGLIWQEINDKGAYEKICQALREGAPDVRRQVLSKMKQATKQADNKGH